MDNVFSRSEVKKKTKLFSGLADLYEGLETNTLTNILRGPLSKLILFAVSDECHHKL